MIGDSHLAMMVNAKKEQRFENLEVTPVSWPPQFYDQLSMRGTEMCADGPELIADWEKRGLAPKIDLAAFQKLVFVSYTITAFSAFAILRDHVISGWNGADFLVRRLNADFSGNTLDSPMEDQDERKLMTPAVFQQCLAGLIRENPTYKLVDHVRKHSSVPIVVVPAPYLAEHTLKHRPLWRLDQVLRKNDGAALARSLHQAHEITFGSFSNVTLLRQPDETVVRGCLTQEMYREGARRYGTGAMHSADDILHAGPLLGRLYLKEICKLIPEG